MSSDTLYLCETLAAVYSGHPIFKYYDYTRDRGFLEKVVYPYLKGCVTFLEGWLDKTDGQYTEQNGRYVLKAGYNEGSWSVNPAIEIAPYKTALDRLIAAAEELGLDTDKRDRWRALRARMPEQPAAEINGKLVYAASEDKTEFKTTVGSNCVTLDCIMPAELIGYYSPESELSIVRNTVDFICALSERISVEAWFQGNSFPRIYTVAVRSRYDARTVIKKLAECLNRQMRSNFRLDDGSHGVEKIGATEAVNNMLLLYDKGVVKIFPNWIEGKKASFANLRTVGGFLFAARHDGKHVESPVYVTSECGGKLTAAAPWAEGMRVFLLDENGEKTSEISLTQGTAPNWKNEITYGFETIPKATYQMECPHAKDGSICK
ncbi:MAG: hypothetical protein LBQ48_00950 [Oscillospiraceae bacterium]|nr:hypothetical protein [Oscillospiraceae bacterium]